MKKYGIFSKIVLGICICGTALAIINGFTGIINPLLSLRGNLLCIGGFVISGGATIILEHERIKK